MADDKLVEMRKFKMDGFSLTMERGAGGATKLEWESAGRFLGKVNRASMFLIGDWVLAGIDAGFTRGDVYDEVESITGLDNQTLRNAVYVSKHVLAQVRRADLPFYHHQMVAALPPEQQEKLLDQAATNNWTGRQLADVVQERIPVSTIPTEPHEVRLAHELFDWVQKARDIPLFADVVAAADKLATSGKRTDFSK
jgi:hypothetical protein